jgi:dTDP-4-amino-4,6-dideoxygalactose transaminase
MPSYTFVSTANAFISKGAIPVFVDIRRDTLNINEDLIEESITSKTRAIVVVHYAGVSCEMEKIISIAKKYNLYVIEDAAHAMISTYNGAPLGSIGDFGTVSFHDTKNIIAGEGGALLVNNSNFIDRAEIIRDKGTNRKKFLRGEIDKYTWVDEGSSHVPSEMISAFLYAQLENAKYITNIRKEIWQEYHSNLEILEQKSKITRPIIPEGANHNGHIYYLLLPDNKTRDKFIIAMKEKGISCTFHYVPLHSSPAGSKIGKYISKPKITEEISERMVRLPIWPKIDSQRVIETTISELS